MNFSNLVLYLQSGGSVGSMVVVGGKVVGALVVVGGIVVGMGLAWSGVNVQSSKNLNSIASIATNPLPLFPLWTSN